MSTLVASTHLATHPAALPINAIGVGGHPTGGLVALLVAIVLVGWLLTILRKVIQPLLVVVRMMLRVLGVAVLGTMALLALVVAVVIR